MAFMLSMRKLRPREVRFLSRVTAGKRDCRPRRDDGKEQKRAGGLALRGRMSGEVPSRPLILAPKHIHSTSHFPRGSVSPELSEVCGTSTTCNMGSFTKTHTHTSDLQSGKPAVVGRLGNRQLPFNSKSSRNSVFKTYF